MNRKPTFKKWLKNKGIKREDFAKKCGFTRQRLEQIINLKDKPKFETIMKVWEAAEYEFALISIWPEGSKMWPNIKKIKKEDLCDNISHEVGKYPDSIV